MSWLEIRWDESGSVFDELDRILEGTAAPFSDAADSDSLEDDSPSYSWMSHPTMPNAKVWSAVPFLPVTPQRALESEPSGTV